MLLCVLQNKHLLYLDLRLQYQYNKTKFCQLVFITTLRTGENTKQKFPRQIFQSTLRVEFAYEACQSPKLTRQVSHTLTVGQLIALYSFLMKYL